MEVIEVTTLDVIVQYVAGIILGIVLLGTIAVTNFPSTK